MAISPWADSTSQESPDGRFVAIFDQSVEIAMGGPSAGRLVIRAKVSGTRIAEFTDAGASFVWASDSSAVAFPRWMNDRTQRLAVLSVPSARVTTLPTVYSVLQLESFKEGVVSGIDSPIHHPIEIRVSGLAQ
jgi:hypothetical protein